MTKYKLNISRDVDADEPGNFILNLPNGYRFCDDIVHTRGFDSMQEMRYAIKNDVIPCNCKQCQKS